MIRPRPRARMPAPNTCNVQRRGQVGVDNQLPRRVVHVDGGDSLGHAGGIDDDVDGPELLGAFVAESRQRGAIGGVGVEAQRAPSHRLDFGGGRVDEIGATCR